MNRKRQKNKFSEILGALIQETGLSRRETARLAGVPSSTLASWLQNHTPSDFLAIRRLAIHFNVSVSFLLTGEEDETRKSIPNISEVFRDREVLFDGYLKVKIQHITKRSKGGPDGAREEENSGGR